ncbi:hypothetical protein [Paenibacillus taihuensis]|uniref:hypothetical protein n=1 Tax=Paenibacillus taihuensis TaxID=1156355 RepID=UPI0011C05433|nr:hypothetical protein [Paenibacillus taihuensis]
MKMLKTSAIVLLTAALVVLSGCSSSKSAKETMLSAMANNQAAKSMTYTGKITLDELTLPQTAAGAGQLPAAAPLVLSVLKGAVINIHGKLQTSPERAELTMDMTLGSGDVKLNLSIPMIITADKMWIKVPQVPGFPIPETISGKFVEIDVKMLEQEQGAGAGLGDLTAVQNIGQDLLKPLLDSLDEKTFFSEPKAADISGLPEGQKADKFVRFSVDESNKDAAITAVMEKAAPQIIDLLLGNEAYMKALQLKKEQLETAKKELADGGKMKDTVDTLKKSVKIDQLDVTGGIKDDYLTYEAMNMKLESTDADTAGMKVGMRFEMSFSDINKEVKFEYELPKDAIPVEQLQGMLGLPSASGS